MLFRGCGWAMKYSLRTEDRVKGRRAGSPIVHATVSSSAAPHTRLSSRLVWEQFDVIQEDGEEI